MDWTGSPSRLTKLAYAETLVAAVSLLLIKQRDAVGLIRFADAVRPILPPRRGGPVRPHGRSRSAPTRPSWCRCGAPSSPVSASRESARALGAAARAGRGG